MIRVFAWTRWHIACKGVGRNLERRRIEMPTIIEYSDTKQAQNQFPERIVSPMRSGPCCFSDMEGLGEPHVEGRWVYAYKRCRRCGFAVRVILREVPNADLIFNLQALFKSSLER
jgi:hypothetical protein